jgi:hypothetical protein
MFKEFELFSSQYTDLIDSGKKLSGTCFRCKTQIWNFANSTRDYLKTVSDSGHAVKIKCSIFHELYEYVKNWQLFSDRIRPLTLVWYVRTSIFIENLTTNPNNFCQNFCKNPIWWFTLVFQKHTKIFVLTNNGTCPQFCL